MKLKPILNKVLKKQLYAVMGKKNAKSELNKIYDREPSLLSNRATELSWLMIWDATPQGRAFWRDVSRQISLL
tara:strand:+ start:1100 stop:1318 length:219 start_codon:yes stop_codon:yes gene_type:complete